MISDYNVESYYLRQHVLYTPKYDDFLKWYNSVKYSYDIKTGARPHK